MVQFSIKKADAQMYKRDIQGYHSKKAFIIGACFAPFAIFLLLVGIFDDKEALGYSCGFLCVSLVSIAFGFGKALEVKNEIAGLFAEYDEIHYSVETSGQVCTVDNVTKNNRIRFDSTSVKKVSRLKNTIVIKLKNNKTIFFPKVYAIDELFKTWDYGVA